jgi:ribosomal protein S18 acetylase RimI-like enzyme
MPLTADPAAVRGILETDRRWAAYALADLAPEYSAAAEWHIAAGGGPALLLLYRGFEPPVLFAHGAVADLVLLLPEIAAEPVFFLSLRKEAVDLLRFNRYEIRHETKMWRMVLNPARFAPPVHNAVRLGPTDYNALASLHRDGDAAGEAPPFFDAGMLRHGVYYGIREGEAMLAAAGTHVLAEQESVAAIGNVYTRRDHRGLGFGAQVSGAVASELLRLGLRLVVLNVAESNAAAMHVYERLGFERYCEYREGIALAPA